MTYENLPLRVRSKFVRTETCWEWIAGKSSNGYGAYYKDNKTMAAHRAIYELMIGEIPDSLQLDHLCRNRGCVNPDHLEPVTARVNVLRGNGYASTNSKKIHCPLGHPYDYSPSRGGRGCKQCRKLAVIKHREKQSV